MPQEQQTPEQVPDYEGADEAGLGSFFRGPARGEGAVPGARELWGFQSTHFRRTSPRCQETSEMQPDAAEANLQEAGTPPQAESHLVLGRVTGSRGCLAGEADLLWAP